MIFNFEKGQYVVLRLRDPKVMDLDLPYRWMPIESTPADSELAFQIPLKGDSYSKSCELMEVGDDAVVFGPMT